MPKNLHKWLLERIAKHRKPLLLGTELTGYAEAEVSLWLNAGVLKRADAPRRVRKVCEDGTERELEVFKHGDAFFGRCTDTEEALDVVQLSEIELTRYGVSRRALATAIVQANRFDPVDFDGSEALPCIAEVDGYAVFLLQPVEKFDDLLPRLHMLASHLGGEGGIIVSPVRISIPTSRRPALAGLGFQILQMGTHDRDPFRIDFRPDAVAETEAEQYLMIRKRGSWTIHYLGEIVPVGSVVGLNYIAKALQRSPEALPMSEWEQDLMLTANDQKDSGGLEARAEPNQNLEATTSESVRKVEKAIDLFKDKLAEAKEIKDTESVQQYEGEIAKLKAHLRATTHRGRPKVIGDEPSRKRLSKNLRTAYAAIDRKDSRIGKFIRNTVIYKNGKLTHEPDEGECWDVRIY